jgi:hypothetical protein
MHVYHYHAIKQNDISSVQHLDGIVTVKNKIITGDDYLEVKASLAENYDISDSSTLILCNFSLLHSD